MNQPTDHFDQLFLSLANPHFSDEAYQHAITLVRNSEEFRSQGRKILFCQDEMLRSNIDRPLLNDTSGPREMLARRAGWLVDFIIDDLHLGEATLSVILFGKTDDCERSIANMQNLISNGRHMAILRSLVRNASNVSQTSLRALVTKALIVRQDDALLASEDIEYNGKMAKYFMSMIGRERFYRVSTAATRANLFSEELGI